MSAIGIGLSANDVEEEEKRRKGEEKGPRVNAGSMTPVSLYSPCFPVAKLTTFPSFHGTRLMDVAPGREKGTGVNSDQ